ncbi:MAG: cobalt ECF transporter T component CbiQ [Nitrospirota bacterium]
MKAEIFSEAYAEKGGFIRRMDARAKVIASAACLVLAVASPNPAVPFIIGIVCFALLLVSGTPLKAVIFRISEPLFFALIIVLLKAFLTPGAPLARIALFGVKLSLSAQGLGAGLHIMARVFGAVFVVLFLTMTTPVHKLLAAAARLRVPKALVELSLFAYRYVFVLLEDAVTIYQAQKIRLGYAGMGVSVRSLGTLCGAVFVRAYSRAEAAADSMELRGYEG